jgi:hypothetical protein
MRESTPKHTKINQNRPKFTKTHFVGGPWYTNRKTQKLLFMTLLVLVMFVMELVGVCGCECSVSV